MRHLVTLAVVAWVFASSCSARVSHELLRGDVQLKALRDASGKGMVGELGSLMEGVDADASDTNGNAPLILAVVRNKEATASALRGKVAGVSAKYLKGNSAWWMVAGSNAGDVPDLLVQQGGDASTQNNEGVSPILMASERSFYSAVKSLPSLNAELAGTDLSGSAQLRSPLGLVSLTQKLQAANILLSYDEEKNEGEIWDRSVPIHMTGKGCESGVLVWLLNNEANPASKHTNSNLPGDVICMEDMVGVSTDILDSQRRRIHEVSLTVPGTRDLKGTAGSDETLSSRTPGVSVGNEATETSSTPSSTSQATSVDKVGDSEDLGLQSTSSTTGDGCFFDDCTSEPTTTLRPKIDLSASENPNDADMDTQVDNPRSDDGCFFDDCSDEGSDSGETDNSHSDDGCFFDDCSGEGSDSGETATTPSNDGCFFDDCSGEPSNSVETPSTRSDDDCFFDDCSGEGSDAVVAPEEACFFDNCAPETGTPTPTSGLAPGKDTAKEVNGTHVACLSPPCNPNKSNMATSNVDVLTVDPGDLIHSPPGSNRSVIVVTVACMVGLVILGVIIYLFGVRKLAAMPSEEELVARLDAGNWPDSNGVVKADVEVVSNLPKELGRSEMLRLANTPLAILPEDPPSEENGRHPSPVPPLHIQDMKLLRKKAGKSEKERDGRPHGVMVVENPRQAGGGAHGGKRVAFVDVTSTGNSVVDPPSGSVDLNSRQALMALYNNNHYGDAGRLGDLNYETHTEDSLGSLDPYDPVSESHSHLGGRSRNCKRSDHLTKSENPLYKESNQYTQTDVDSLTGRSDESRDYHNERRISLTGSF